MSGCQLKNIDICVEISFVSLFKVVTSHFQLFRSDGDNLYRERTVINENIPYLFAALVVVKRILIGLTS